MFGLEFFDDRLEGLMLFAGALLHAHDHVAIHLDEPAVAVVGETFVVGQAGEAFHRGVVQSEVEDCVHHARHGVAGTGAHGDEQRVFHVAEFFAHGFLHFDHRRVDLRVELLRVSAFVVVVIGADFGADGETARHRQADARHLRKVRALAAEQGFHFSVTVGFTVAEIVNVFSFDPGFFLGFFAGLCF